MCSQVERPERRKERAVKRACENRPGMSRTDGHWRCANCCVRWGGDAWKERLLVIDVGDDDRFLMYYIGDEVGADEDGKIQLLKASKLVSVLDGKPVTVDTLKAAIVQCNDEAEKRLGSMACVRQLTSVHPQEKGLDDVTVYCEDEALELTRPGTEYRAIDLGALQDTVKKLTKAELNEVLDMCAACMHVESADGLPPALRRARKNVLESEIFHKVRTQILSRL